ncbi:hypothetical protein KEM60_01762 [Austwickia sp. TVS 96-490-7B]|uniref:hypothetical protein n=1 Tax=Austwickia sp. TVS 96-490-7B TaxID=2830843 RepID=UPI001C5A43E5|nr:hypothetical protein [Austwickia sp. TVS 96-490-7B]MBW3085562.1 hypothetical protein [Austwickia sp. TVS 96-490-7B]
MTGRDAPTESTHNHPRRPPRGRPPQQPYDASEGRTRAWTETPDPSPYPRRGTGGPHHPVDPHSAAMPRVPGAPRTQAHDVPTGHPQTQATRQLAGTSRRAAPAPTARVPAATAPVPAPMAPAPTGAATAVVDTAAESTKEDDDKPSRIGVTVPQLFGGACAAMSAALVASKLGVAGTLIGAAIASIVSTIASAQYTNMANRVHQFLRSYGLGKDKAKGADSSSSTPRTTKTQVLSQDKDGSYVEGRATRRFQVPRQAWLGGLAMFAIAMGTITVIEFGLGHPVAHSDEKGTSISNIIERPPAPPEPTQVPTQPHQPVAPPVAPTTGYPGGPTPTGGGTFLPTPSQSVTGIPTTGVPSAPGQPSAPARPTGPAHPSIPPAPGGGGGGGGAGNGGGLAPPPDAGRGAAPPAEIRP